MMYNRIRRNLILILVWSGLSFFFPVITLFYITKVIHPEVIGKISFAESFISFFSVFAQLGMPIYGLRACAKCRDNDDVLQKTVIELIIISIFLHITSYMILVVVSFAIPKLYANRELLLIIGTNILLQSFECEWLFKALEKYPYIAIRSFCMKLISLILMFALVRRPTDYLIYGWLIVISTSGSNIIDLISLQRTVFKKRISFFNSSTNNRLSIKRHIKPLLMFFLMSCATSIYGHLDTVMLEFVKDDYVVGLYSVALKVKVLLTLFGSVVWNVSLPEASSRWKLQDKAGFGFLGKRSINLIWIFQFPIMLICLIYSREVIYLAGGTPYLLSINAFRILLLSVLPIGLSNIYGGQLLIPADMEDKLFKAEVIGALSNVVLNGLLIPGFSMEGAAVATLISEIVVCVITYYYVKKYIGIVSLTWSHIGKICIGCILACAVSLLFKKIWLSPVSISGTISSMLLYFIISSAVFIIFYVVSELVLREEIIWSVFNEIRGKIKCH